MHPQLKALVDGLIGLTHGNVSSGDVTKLGIEARGALIAGQFEQKQLRTALGVVLRHARRNVHRYVDEMLLLADGSVRNECSELLGVTLSNEDIALSPASFTRFAAPGDKLLDAAVAVSRVPVSDSSPFAVAYTGQMAERDEHLCDIALQIARLRLRVCGSQRLQEVAKSLQFLLADLAALESAPTESLRSTVSTACVEALENGQIAGRGIFAGWLMLFQSEWGSIEKASEPDDQPALVAWADAVLRSPAAAIRVLSERIAPQMQSHKGYLPSLILVCRKLRRAQRMNAEGVKPHLLRLCEVFRGPQGRWQLSITIKACS